jgi:DNA helicase INO80
VNFRVPQPDDEFDYYGNSSQDESRGSQGNLIYFFECFILYFDWNY